MHFIETRVSRNIEDTFRIISFRSFKKSALIVAFNTKNDLIQKFLLLLMLYATNIG